MAGTRARSLCSQCDHTASCRGFSLVELAILLVCVAAVTLASVPAFGRVHQAWSLWTGTCLMESTLQWGRLRSITANASLMLEVDPDGTSAGWLDPETGGAYDSGVCRLPRGVRIISSPSKPVRFYPRGNAVPAGSFVLGNNAGSFRIVVSPAGRIRVERL